MAGESTLQRQCRAFAIYNNVLMRKVRAEGKRGWPDWELIFPHTGETIRIEMKNPNGKGRLHDLQRIEHILIRGQNAVVYTCDSYDYFCKIIKRHLKCKPEHS